MHFASIKTSFMEINPWKFKKQFTIYKFTNSPKKFFSSPWKLGSHDGVAWIELNIYCYHGFQSIMTLAYNHAIQCIKYINLSNIKTDSYHTSILQESWLHLIFILLMLFLGFFSSRIVFNYSYCFRYYHSNWGQ